MNEQISPLVAEQRKQIGARIAEYRKRKNMTQEELAAMMGITKSSINKMERGVWLSVEMLIRLSEILNFRIELISQE
jgi:transcriptional regulator with XRE-family HTH domain